MASIYPAFSRTIPLNSQITAEEKKNHSQGIMTFLQESYDIKVCQGIILPLMELLTIIPLYTHHYPIIVRIEKSHHSQGIKWFAHHYYYPIV